MSWLPQARQSAQEQRLQILKEERLALNQTREHAEVLLSALNGTIEKLRKLEMPQRPHIFRRVEPFFARVESLMVDLDREVRRLVKDAEGVQRSIEEIERRMKPPEQKWSGRTDSKSEYYRLRQQGLSHEQAVAQIEGYAVRLSPEKAEAVIPGIGPVTAEKFTPPAATVERVGIGVSGHVGGFDVFAYNDVITVMAGKDVVAKQKVEGLSKFIEKNKGVVRLSLGKTEDFNIIYFLDKEDFGYAFNVEATDLSEWGYGPPPGYTPPKE